MLSSLGRGHAYTPNGRGTRLYIYPTRARAPGNIIDHVMDVGHGRDTESAHSAVASSE